MAYYTQEQQYPSRKDTSYTYKLINIIQKLRFNVLNLFIQILEHYLKIISAAAWLKSWFMFAFLSLYLE